MMIETEFPIRIQYKFEKKSLQLSLLKSNTKYRKLGRLEEQIEIKYGFRIVLDKDSNIIFALKPLEALKPTMNVNIKISIPSTKFSFSIEHDCKSGTKPFEKVVCSYRELFASTKKYFVDNELILTFEGCMRYRHKDPRKFSCAVCFVEYPFIEKFTCETTDSAVQKHSFCRECLVNHASTEGAQLIDARFQCMEYGCKNSIAYSSAVKKILPLNITIRIDDRIMEEDLAKCGLNLERCRNCNFAVEMEYSKEQNMVFPCPMCEKEWCRLCEREWNDEHRNFTCDELNAKQAAEMKKREFEQKLSEAVIRKCECGLQFMKEDGCNKMTCRCKRTQCYLCREKNITYNHFCGHEFPLRGMACPCGKKCTLWADAKKFDQTVIDGINAEAAQEGIQRIALPPPEQPAVAPQPRRVAEPQLPQRVILAPQPPPPQDQEVQGGCGII